MKKYFQLKNIIIGKIDKNHPQSEEINKAVDEFNKAADNAFTSVSKMTNDITSFTDDKRK
ncbi:hypothetical protein ACZ11_07480 [Lysinibacillus xylanilyticus]|uniref:Uncharacterized protein n=1 Tax=Lysinibacillus xylanilyticus TaxID=582475 RepID=A0A0K9FCS5_9BACI|nr:hypothetical protein [Lysinibacillus xylanilyticus]KMY32008.1 hypothetical protein ACZ11_07480 [Lysinibacillus xylanilyticus]